MIARFAILLAAASLAACAASPEEIATAQHAQCTEFGHAAGSPGYSDCRMTLLHLQAQTQAANVAGMQGMAQTMQATNMMLLAQRQQRAAEAFAAGQIYPAQPSGWMCNGTPC